MRLAEPDPLPPEFADAFARSGDRLGIFARSILYFHSVGSTNDVASTLAGQPGIEGVVVMADAQTAGRGRRGRRWFSPPGSGLYVSTLLNPARAHAGAERATALLTLAAGLALAESVETATGLRPDIKWPNDLTVGRRKLAGVLAEGIVTAGGLGGGVSAVVLGYGVNVGPMAYPPDLADRATSLETELGRSIDRASFAVETLVALARRYDDLLHARFDAILDAWLDRAPASRGARVTWETPSGRHTGVTEGVDESGALIVRVGDRVDRLVAGEVNWS